MYARCALRRSHAHISNQIECIKLTLDYLSFWSYMGYEKMFQRIDDDNRDDKKTRV